MRGSNVVFRDMPAFTSWWFVPYSYARIYLLLFLSSVLGEYYLFQSPVSSRSAGNLSGIYCFSQILMCFAFCYWCFCSQDRYWQRDRFACALDTLGRFVLLLTGFCFVHFVVTIFVFCYPKWMTSCNPLLGTKFCSWMSTLCGGLTLLQPFFSLVATQTYEL